MKIKSHIKNYDVNICQDFQFVDELLREKNALFVIDECVYRLYYEKLFFTLKKENIYLIPAAETNKIIDTALDICQQMTQIPAKRNAHLISFGGGIIQDISGFAANILYRGIRWTYVPTTLLAACDSCIGGKTSLNYKNYKNLLGTFYPPDAIYITPRFFNTLTERDYESGLGEVIKFNMMLGLKGISSIENDFSDICNRNEEILNKYIKKSLLFKKEFIEKDEFDKKERVLLNFAHTFGHAYETISDYSIPHGTAVAMGMITANRISLSRKILDEDYVKRMEDILLRIIHIDVNAFTTDIPRIIDAMKKDKKQVDDNLTAILMYGDMKLRLFHDIQQAEVQAAVLHLYNMLKQQLTED